MDRRAALRAQVVILSERSIGRCFRHPERSPVGRSRRIPNLCTKPRILRLRPSVSGCAGPSPPWRRLDRICGRPAAAVSFAHCRSLHGSPRLRTAHRAVRLTAQCSRWRQECRLRRPTHKLGKSGHWIRKLGRSGLLRPVFGLQTAGSAQFARRKARSAQFARQAGENWADRAHTGRQPGRSSRFRDPA